MGLARALGAALGRVNAAHLDVLRAAVDREWRRLRADRGRRPLRGVPGGGGRRHRGGRCAAGADGRRLARRTPRSGCGWASTRARPTSPATITAASMSTARPASRPSATAARSSCPAPTAGPRRVEPAARRPGSQPGPGHAQGRPAAGAALPARRPGPSHGFPAAARGRRAVGNLPERLTSFIGREQDLLELGGLLDATRLVTLTGPGGSARPAWPSNWPRRRGLPDGAWFVALDADRRPGAGRSAIARTLGLFDGTTGTAGDALPAFMAERSHAPRPRQLRARHRSVRRSSRRSSRLAGLPVRRCEPVAAAPQRRAGVPGQAPAVGGRTRARRRDAAARLFIERARAVRPGLDPAPDLGRRGDLHAARRPAARHRTRRGEDVAPARDRHPRPARRAAAPARARPARRAGSTAHPRRSDRLEPRPPRARGATPAARPGGLPGRVRPRTGRAGRLPRQAGGESDVLDD